MHQAQRTFPPRLSLPARCARAASIVLIAAVSIFVPLPSQAADAPKPVGLELRKGDHLSIVGNTLADRMQHDGWLETYLVTRFPTHDLTIRNLGFSADEVAFRLRSANFGSPDEWLAKNKTDVVLAFFGYNESFGDLTKFRADLDAFIDHTLAQKYNGKSAPKLVLVSPIAHENLNDPHLPDGTENNQRIEKITLVMAEAAKAKGISFVDLFRPTLQTFPTLGNKHATINGIHLNEHGNAIVARMIDQALFGDPGAAQGDGALMEKVRQAVLDKNFTWFNRYRTVDGYSVFGGRAELRFVGGQTNKVVAQREMEVLDVMTANRDQKIWAVAQGKEFEVKDDNTPPFIPVLTNKPGNGPNGEHIFIDGDETIANMTVAKGLKINLFVSEKQFPNMASPVQMSFDAKGRLWVAVWPTYPHWKPKEEMNDKLLIYEDTDGDGRADKEIVFADHLHCPTGFEFALGGVYIAQQPDIMFLKDVDGDDKADVRTRVISGMDSADTHHASNSFRLDPGGALYWQEGTFHQTQVETPYGPPQRCSNAGVFRYEPRTQKFDVYVSYGFANPHGHVFDRWGEDFITDGTGNVNYFAAAFSGHVDYPHKHAGIRPFFQQRTRPCAATEILSSRHFPYEFQGDYLVCNVIGFQGIHRYKFRDAGSGFAADELEPIVSSTDPNFRPVDVEVSPDGALYFLDWQNPVIGHMQHNLRDPSRDRTHGRVYRVVHEGRPLLKPEPIAGEPVEKLLDLLKSPEDRVRYRVKIELSARDSNQVAAALEQWIAALDKNEPEYEHHRLEGLWMRQWLDMVDVKLLDQVLHSPDQRARAAATRVLCYWRDRVPGALDRLKTLAADPYPRVRLEAVRAASFFTDADAVEVPLISAEKPTDYFLDYTRAETMKTLEPYWTKALAEGRSLNIPPAAAKFFLKTVKTEDLLKMKRERGVDLEIMFRDGVGDADRLGALADLARVEKKSQAQVLIEAIQARDSAPTEGNRDDSASLVLARLMGELPTKELAPLRGLYVRLATDAVQPITREFAYSTLIATDGKIDAAWEIAIRSVKGLRDLLATVPLIRNPAILASLHPKIEPLLRGLPEGLGSASPSKETKGRFVRIELPGKKTLTLAEVEVISDGRNVARQGKATQKNTSNGGFARKAIDGNTSGAFGNGGQTHSEENTDNPWWELDLGTDRPVSEVVIHNRTDGELGKRLEGYTLKVLDSLRNPVFEKEGLPAPAGKAAVALGGNGPEGAIRRAAMNALTLIPGHEAETSRSLAGFVNEGVDRNAAIQALQRIPAGSWPKDEAKPLLESLIAYVATIPPAERTSLPALDALQLGDTLAGLLPADQGRSLRKRLADLGVRVLRVGTVPEQMRYDVERLVVQAGKPVEILFRNDDTMPHNLVVTQPGALEEVGMLAEATALQPGAMQRQYVPPSSKILLASKLVNTRESQVIRFSAPSQPGVYPFVCTYPGHWRRMYGSLYVVADVDDYLANPESYLAAHNLPILDELLKFTRPRKEWTFDELASSVAQLEHGRSFRSAEKVFQAATCVSCHRVNGVGSEFGPDLAKLDPKLTAAEILKNILEPSAKIDEKYATTLIETDSGQVISGLILSEDADTVKVIENPLAKAEPRVIKKAEIVGRKQSTTSMMPKGLLDKLTREEIIDLISFLAAHGDKADPLFQGGHEGHAH